jgi:hypothetical protein
MSTYFELIQNVSKEFIGKSPATFAEITDKKYKDIVKELKEALLNFMLTGSHNFREKMATFTTVLDQQGYPHVYGNILNEGLSIENDSAEDTPLSFDPDWKALIRKKNYETHAKPSAYSIGLGQILLSPKPDDEYLITVLYKTHNFVKGVYSIDQSSASGQSNLYLTSTTGLSAGSILVIDPNTALEETITVLSVTTNDYVVATSNLTKTHAAGSRAVVYKSEFQYETDEPDFPAIFHKILEYMALMQLYYDDMDNLKKYQQQYFDFYKAITGEASGTKDSNTGFSM